MQKLMTKIRVELASFLSSPPPLKPSSLHYPPHRHPLFINQVVFFHFHSKIIDDDDDDEWGNNKLEQVYTLFIPPDAADAKRWEQ